jgi:probable rRNA maturation factor
MAIEIRNESGVPIDERGLERLARHVLDTMGVHPLVELSIMVVDVDTMAEYHERYMGEPGPTDVLAFEMDELGSARHDVDDDEDSPPTHLGDVMLCPEVARTQAAQAGHSMQDELHLLCTHGVLHLLGYNHMEPEEEREMFALQDQLLSAWRDQRGSRA